MHLTAAVDNLLSMKNAGAQWSMVSYLKKLNRNEKRKEREKSGGHLGSASQSGPISLK